ncbi:hypothetical protein EON79_17790 [bacterium]|nr:MAG: hypothetical protein EON79_17790 [bacterium]
MFIASWRGTSESRAKAEEVFFDDSRILIASSIIRLELAPHSGNRPEEIAHFQSLFEFIHLWVSMDDALVGRAREIRTAFDVASIDALHLAAAELAVTDQFITTERPGKPLYRVSHLGPVFLSNL